MFKLQNTAKLIIIKLHAKKQPQVMLRTLLICELVL